MAAIVVRGLEAEVVRQLKVVAACRGRSMEEEVRSMLRERMSTPVRGPLAPLAPLAPPTLSPQQQPHAHAQALPLAVTLLSMPGYGWEWPR